MNTTATTYYLLPILLLHYNPNPPERLLFYILFGSGTTATSTAFATSYRHGQCRVAACGPGPLRWPTAAGTLTPLSSKCDVSAVWAVSWACVLRILVQGLGFRIRGLGFKISGVSCKDSGPGVSGLECRI